MTELIMKLKSWGQKLLLMVGGVITGLLIIETFAISTGFAVPHYVKDFQRYYYEFLQPDEQLIFKPQPNLRNYENYWTGIRVKEIDNTDSYGFRNFGEDYAKSNLYFVGDSFTWGLWVEREKTFYGLIKSEIKQSVISLGVPNYGFEQYEVLFRDWVAKYKPRTSVLCVFANDLDKLKSPTAMENAYQEYKFNKNQSLPWHQKSFLYQSVFNKKERQEYERVLEARKETKKGLLLLGDLEVLGSGYTTSINYLKSHVNIQVEEALERVINLANSIQTQLFIFLIPSKESTYFKDYAELFPYDVKYLENEEIGYERLCQLAKAKDVTCVDLTMPFRQHGEKEKLYLDLDTHWNAAGHKLAAQLILDTLKQEKGLNLTTDITARTTVNEFPYIATHQVQ